MFGVLAMPHNPFKTWEEMRRVTFDAIPDDGELGRALRLRLDDLADACGGVSDAKKVACMLLPCLECKRLYALIPGALDVRRRVADEMPTDAENTVDRPNAAFRAYLAERLYFPTLFEVQANIQSFEFYLARKCRLSYSCETETELEKVSRIVGFCEGQILTLRDSVIAALALCGKCGADVEKLTVAECIDMARSERGHAVTLERIEAILREVNKKTGAIMSNRLAVLLAQRAAGKAGAKAAKAARGVDSQRAKIYKAAQRLINNGTKTDAAFSEVAERFGVDVDNAKSMYYRERKKRADETRGKYCRDGNKRGRYGTIGHKK